MTLHLFRKKKNFFFYNRFKTYSLDRNHYIYLFRGMATIVKEKETAKVLEEKKGKLAQFQDETSRFLEKNKR